MTAFLKIDNCKDCHRSLPWEWVPAILLDGKALAGTGVWRSQLAEDRCPACHAAEESRRQGERRAVAFKRELIQLLGGEMPYREFTFERYEVTPGNRLAYERCRQFCPATENLYLWGPCGVGKTHLAYAAIRCCWGKMLSAAIVPAGQLSRKVRLSGADHEQATMHEWTGTAALLLDDLGVGPDTVYIRQLIQEILDTRCFHDRNGLVITSKYSLDQLAAKLADDSIPSRLAGCCRAIEVTGADRRLLRLQLT